MKSEIELNFSQSGSATIHKLEKIVDKNRFKTELADQVARVSMEFVNIVKLKYLTNNPVHVRTGHLRNSFGNRLSPFGVFIVSPYHNGAVVAQIGTTLKYAPVVEEGADIYPKKANGALAIPVGDALTPSGVPRFNWKQRGDIPQQYPDLFMIKSKNGNPLLVRKVGQQIRPMFVLSKHVHIEGRYFLHKAADIYLPMMEQKITAWIEDYMV